MLLLIHLALPIPSQWKYVLNDISLLILENELCIDFDYSVDELITIINDESFVLNDAIKHGTVLTIIVIYNLIIIT